MSEHPLPTDLQVSNERRGAVEQAVSYLTGLIDLRRVRPGDRLPSAAVLAAEVGVSRPAVLQALKLLASQGRVIVRSGRGGTWVAGHEAENLDVRLARAWENRDRIIQMAHLREMLEAGAARLVAERGGDPAALADARRLAADMRERDFVDVELYRSLDTDFHLAIGRATGMPLVESFVAMCRREVSAAFDVMNVPQDRKRSSDDEHDELLDAIEARSGDRAAEIARRHTSTTTRLLESVLAGATPAFTNPTNGAKR